MTDPDAAALDDPRFLLSRAPWGARHGRLAAALLAALVLAAAAASPFARVPLVGSEPFLAAYATAVLVNDLITAVLLLALASVISSAAMLTLAAGYLFLALTIVPWVLTFPGALAPEGLIDAGLHGTAAVAAFRRLGFPLFVIAYVLLKERNRIVTARNAAKAVLATITATTVFVGAMSWLILARDGALPALMEDSRSISALWYYVSGTALVLYLVVLALLLSRGRSVLDLWLVVVMGTLLVEIVLLSYISAGSRLSVGWWTGRAFGLVSASIVLFVLLAETTMLYARLARAMAAERRAREARLATMEALSASIAHEINQPLASMVTNADAGLRWLERDRPDLEEARAALGRVVREGHRAGHVVDGIRSIFRKGAHERLPLDVNNVVKDVLRELQCDLRIAGISIHTELDPRLPHIRANRIQIEQVVTNLVCNAVEATASVIGPRRVRLVTASETAGGVVVAVEDTGRGLGPSEAERIFEPFVSSKADGLGMGLMLCRSIVEAHGGRLWAEGAVARGAVFKFSLPRDVGETAEAPER